MVLICISLVINNVEHLSMYPLATSVVVIVVVVLFLCVFGGK